MPTLLRQSRYRPLAPFYSPSALSPGTDEQSLAINPQFQDYLAEPEDQDQWRSGIPSAAPPIPPVQAKVSSMPPGVEPSPAPPQAPPGVEESYARPTPPPQPLPEESEANEVAAPPEKDEEPIDYSAKRKAVLDRIENEHLRTPTQPKSNWAQRLGMGLLAATKLAPMANMIVHPKWAAEERKRQANLAAAEGEFKDLNTAEQIEAQAEMRKANAAKNSRDKHYMSVGGGVYDLDNKKWLEPPRDKSQLTPITREEAEVNGIAPLPDGSFAIPNTAVGSLITSHKEAQPKPSLHVVNGSVVSYTPGDDVAKVVYKGDPDKPGEIVDLEVDGKPHKVLINKATGERITDLGPSGYKPQAINVNAQNNREDRSFQYNNGELDKIVKPVEDALPRMSRLQETLAQGTPQADALVAPELLTIMAGGAGSGLRMNEAEIARIIGGRTNWEGIKAKLGAWQANPSKGFAITPEQRQQINALVTKVHEKLLQKQEIASQSHRGLIGTDDPKEHRRIVQEAREQLNAIDQSVAKEKPIVQHSPSTGAYRYSTDGGKTWLPGQPPK